MISRVNQPGVPLPLPATETPPEANVPARQQHHHHEKVLLHRPATRPRTKKRKGADSQDGIDESGASEELLMMLEEHLQNSEDMIMRVGERRHGAQGDSGSGTGSQGDDHPQDAPGAVGRRGARLSRASAGDGEVDGVRERAEEALIEARHKQGTPQHPKSWTYEVLAIALDFLAMPAPKVSEATLAAVRAQLIVAVPAPTSPAPTHQQSMNVLLPLMMLSLKRKRTDEERGRAIAINKSLLGARRVA
ncbi:hypothetical protein WKR88_15145 [Trinickia caryophylli]|uniref:Type III secretion regulatory protein HpaA n=1 Tax=Trinickia caryophylli TaxID=28094 RepID=A0A1X7D6I5_TRICW|nr:hypothetical protein [Trinickia caryophylli]PMS12679.1 hypothetical protein C0Z17_07540 [Trinickia caryophylli]TRX15085.1 hypothetical protein FNF07_28215 [Trinickia caryophylli]WQE14944.1 hypothetical protein U0034_20540 [Trinickia caryophylli]SMF09783.1 hypothetical protein SAMN06295900_102454 [Trinickia caryophylli]GLU31327.1 hypothetical protein Busp01_11690 [Trinickia caryophylli]